MPVPINFESAIKCSLQKTYTGKKPKLAPSYKGPGEIIYINDTNAKVKIGNKIKLLRTKLN
jgi:hypothetical protein